MKNLIIKVLLLLLLKVNTSSFLNSTPIIPQAAKGNSVCYTPPPPPPPCDPKCERKRHIEPIVKNLIIYNNHIPENKWFAKEFAYRMLRKNPGWLTVGNRDDTLYQQFYSNVDMSNIGKFVKINEHIRNGNIIQAKTLNSSINPQNLIESDLKTVNNIYLNTWAVGIDTFTVQDSVILYSIANKDPMDCGHAGKLQE